MLSRLRSKPRVDGTAAGERSLAGQELPLALTFLASFRWPLFSPRGLSESCSSASKGLSGSVTRETAGSAEG
jgi:hypothetical protein